MKTILETERLILREMTVTDFPSLCKHLQDAQVMYAFEHAFSDDEVQQGIDKQLKTYEQYGFGVWAVILKENTELIGQCGLSMQPCEDREVLETGYIFQKKYWRKGYAAEAAIACREYAFNKLNADEVFSIIRDTNIASQNVAKRNGMRIRGSFVKHYYGVDMPHYIFSVKRNSVMINGKNVELVDAELGDRQHIYDWCYYSQTTKSHSGPPDYPENPIATWEEFFDEGYVDYFFTGAQPQSGRGFLILHEGEAVGFISYCSFHLKPGKSELDIWLNSEANCGKGFGTDAIVSLGSYLNKNLGVTELIMRPSARNARAIKAYMKAGFRRSDKSADCYLLDEYMPLYGAGDYGEGGDVLLIKQFD